MIALFPTNFPPSTTPVIDPSGIMTNPGNNFWRALWNRTGGGTGIANQIAPDLTAAGTTQATALALTSDWNDITTTASGMSVLLPALTGGQSVMVANQGLNPLKIYPSSGAQIDALGSNNPYSLATLKMQIFWFVSSTVILSTQLG